MEQGRKRWLGWSLVALLIIGMVTLHVLFEINRFSGECKHFRDSSGGFVKNENGETVYKCNAETDDDTANNDSPHDEALPIGRQSGPIGGVSRSLGVWVVSAVFYLIVSSLCFVLLGSRCCGRCGASSDDLFELRNGVFRHRAVAEADIKQHSKELFRIVMIVYLCTVLAVAYKLLAIWMGIQCDGNAAHVLYSLLGGTTYVAQSMQLMYEIRSNQRRGEWLRAVFLFLSVYNLVSWSTAITDTACLKEQEMAYILGRAVWKMFRPIFRSMLIFLRIFSASVYFHLFMHSNETSMHEDSSEQKEEQSDINLETMGTILGDSMATKDAELDENSKTTVAIYKQSVHCVRRSNSIFYYRRLIMADQRRCLTLIMSFSLLFLVLVFIFPVWYGFMVAKESRKQHDNISQHGTYRFVHTLEPVPNIVMNVVAAIFSIAFLIELLPNFDTLLEHFKNRKWCRQLVNDAEAIALSIFAVGACVYLLMSSIIYTQMLDDKWSLALVWISNAFAAFSVCSQLILILTCKILRWHKKLSLKHGIHYYDSHHKRRMRVVFFMSILVLVSLGLIVQAILEEEFNDSVHRSDLLHGFIPLLVDYRVHMTILTFALMYDLYGKDRVTECLLKEEVESFGEPPSSPVHKNGKESTVEKEKRK